MTASTAENPTPKRPTVSPSRLAEARRVASASTPAASSGAPVFAATRTARRRSVRRSRSRPGSRRPGRGVGRVLGQLDDDPVPVGAEDEVLLGVGVLAEAGRPMPATQPARAAGSPPSRTDPPAPSAAFTPRRSGRRSGRRLESPLPAGPARGLGSPDGSRGGTPASQRSRRGSAPAAARRGTGSTAVSECAPQPWSALTTRPSGGDHSLRAGAEDRRSAPATARRSRRSRRGPARARPSRRRPGRRRRTSARPRPRGRRSDSTRTRPRPSSERELVLVGLVRVGVGRAPGRGRRPGTAAGRRRRGRRGAAGPDQGTQAGARTRPIAGEQHDLVDRDGARARRAGHGDRPAPAAVARGRAGEVGDDPLALGGHAEVVADRAAAPASSTAASLARSTGAAEAASGSVVQTDARAARCRGAGVASAPSSMLVVGTA